MEYRFLYRREQRHYFSVDAENEMEARIKAGGYITQCDFNSPADESEDPGDLDLEGNLDPTDAYQ